VAARPRWAHSARVAAVAAGVVVLAYVLVAFLLDLYVFNNQEAQLQARLSDRLRAARAAPGFTRPGASGGQGATSQRPLPDQELSQADPDDAPVYLWSLRPGHPAAAITPGAPALPGLDWKAGPVLDHRIGSSPFRFEAAAGPGELIVAGESAAGLDHNRSVLLELEAALIPVVFLGTAAGALVIGVRASGPVEQARRRQLDFTADASHELRTPLSVIEAEVSLALTAPRAVPYYEATLGRISSESARLRKMVEDLLWLARFDSEPPPPSDQPVDLVRVARENLARFQPVAQARHLRLSAGPDASGPVAIHAPPEWVDRLVGVLVDNACRHAPWGGRVTVSARRADRGEAVLAVEDDGPGIPPEERDRLFDRFHRATQEPGGVGLGLAIADSVVRGTGGRWRIGTSVMGGTSMTVSWPAAGGPSSRQLVETVKKSRDSGVGPR
jgi:signal transduction histidine kinase